MLGNQYLRQRLHFHPSRYLNLFPLSRALITHTQITHTHFTHTHSTHTLASRALITHTHFTHTHSTHTPAPRALINVPLMGEMDLHSFWGDADLRFCAYCVPDASVAGRDRCAYVQTLV